MEEVDISFNNTNQREDKNGLKKGITFNEADNQNQNLALA